MKKRVLLSSVLAVLTIIASHAEAEAIADTNTAKAENGSPEKKEEVFSKPKVSGFFIGQYQFSDPDGESSNTLSVRMLRLTVTGRILNDFQYTVQGQASGNTENLSDSPRLLDANIEWQKFNQFKVKAGQFKLPFTFDNASNPIDVGFTNFSQGRQKLVNASDRSGARSSNGRDIGVQIQGDLFPGSDGHSFLHYQVGVFNGQGTNTKDVDNQKDIVGGIWIAPINGLRIGVFGWTGSYARQGTITDEDGSTHTGVLKVDKQRYAFGAEYSKNDYLFRAEYIHNTGYGFKTQASKDDSESDLTINTSNGNKADAFYALASVPVIGKKGFIRARYDLYRKAAKWDSSKTQYELQFKYILHKNLIVALEYALVNDRTLEDHNYNLVDAQFIVRF